MTGQADHSPAADRVEITDEESAIALTYLGLLDYVGRCAGAVDTGGWHYLWQKLPDLQDRAGHLLSRLSDLDGDYRAPDARAQAVLAYLIEHGAPYYRAARQLHLAPETQLTEPKVRPLPSYQSNDPATDYERRLLAEVLGWPVDTVFSAAPARKALMALRAGHQAALVESHAAAAMQGGDPQ